MNLIVRKTDKYGSGEFGARRGDHVHEGLDLVFEQGASVVSFGEGVVTKIGIVYGDDHSYKYVQVTDSAGGEWRYMYVNPTVHVGNRVFFESPLGYAQAIENRYPGITPHIHLEIRNGKGELLNPRGILSEWLALK